MDNQVLKQEFSGILFDLGNTLIYFDGNWEEVALRSYQILAESLHLKNLIDDERVFVQAFKERMARYFAAREVDLIEHSTEAVLKSFLNEKGGIPVSDEELQTSLDAMYGYTENFWHLESDTIETLIALQGRGFHLGLVSNAANLRNVHRLLDRFGLREFFDPIMISASVGIRKPHPEIFCKALDALNLPPEKVLMVGDTFHADIVGANQLGMPSAWITRRVDNIQRKIDQETIRPDWMIDNLRELFSILS